ncbi:hypothetical protein HA48_08530 [Pantoea wallisii]|uniref:DUF2681 domain-containing protein n=1 Tax=Pantoea wallisii TaxID=1076551 RepID=A0A1X1DAA9_9GAMM|nr:hypothetical protein [Pantoea wallisii]ORM73606.1 hypothetical protein HA48_08530 [Pantoea wallisii]
MSFLLSLLGGSWHWLAAIGGVLAALAASYFGGKKIGKVQQQARADRVNAEKTAAQAVAVNQQQQQLREEAKRVETSNSNLDDAAARDKLQRSKYHQP